MPPEDELSPPALVVPESELEPVPELVPVEPSLSLPFPVTTPTVVSRLVGSVVVLDPLAVEPDELDSAPLPPGAALGPHATHAARLETATRARQESSGSRKARVRIGLIIDRH